MERLKVVSNHISLARHEVASRKPTFSNSPEDVVVVAAKRTPIGKAKRGSFKVENQICYIFIN